MAIKYLAGDRLQGTAAERAALTTGYTDGNGLNGTATAITVDTAVEPSFTTGCYDFNGTSSKVTISDSLGTTAFSLSTWFRTDSASGNQSIYGQLGLGLNLYMSGSNIRCSQGGGGSQLIGSTTISADTWYNVIFTKTASVGSGTAKLYLNNSLEDTETDWSDFQTSQTSLISGHQTDWWNGFITDFAIWNTVISSATRTAINAGSGALISSLSDKANITTYYPFTSLDGSTVTNVATSVYPNLPNGGIFEESDTGKHYMWDGTDTWNEIT
jgi:hypothetical protein